MEETGHSGHAGANDAEIAFDGRPDDGVAVFPGWVGGVADFDEVLEADLLEGRRRGRKGVRICFVCIIEREEERKLALTILQMVTNMPTIKMVRTPVFLRQEMLSFRKLCNGKMKTTTS